jgi:hypothetical protein
LISAINVPFHRIPRLDKALLSPFVLTETMDEINQSTVEVIRFRALDAASKEAQTVVYLCSMAVLGNQSQAWLTSKT